MKTQTKKSPTKKASTQEKSPVAKKTVPAKKVVSKAKVEKVAPKKTAPVVASPVPKKVVTKSVPVKKATPVKKESASKSETPSTNNTIKTSAKEGVKMLGILHLVGNLGSGLTSTLLILIYFLIKRDELSKIEKETCYEIINFQLSFLIYLIIGTGISALGAFLAVIIVGVILLPALPIVFITWFILMIIGFLSHLQGENYKYPFIIRFIS